MDPAAPPQIDPFAGWVSRMHGWRLFWLPFALGTALWARPAGTVRLATLEWEPYIGADLPNGGYVQEIVREAFQAVGYRVEVTFYPWARAVAMASSGRVDALFPEYYDEKRLDTFVYSSAFPGGPVGLLVRADRGIQFPSDPRKDPTKALWGLRDYRFGVVRGYVNTKAFDEATFLVKEEAVSDDQNIQKLLARRVDCIFIDQYVADHLLRMHYPLAATHLVFLAPPLETKELYLAFSRKAPGYERKLRDFNTGLAQLKRTGRLRAIMHAHGF